MYCDTIWNYWGEENIKLKIRQSMLNNEFGGFWSCEKARDGTTPIKIYGAKECHWVVE